MNNVFDRDLKPVKTDSRTLHSSDLLPGLVKGRNLESGMYAIYFGLSANRPDGSSHVRAWWSTDTGVLSIWNGTAWLSTTLV